MHEKQLTSLIEKYLSGEATEAEKTQVEQWYESMEFSTRKLKQEEFDEIDASEARSLDALTRKLSERHSQATETTGREVIPSAGSRRRWLVAAAVVAMIASASLFFLFRSSRDTLPAPASRVSETNILPGGTKAILTLGNGIKITLDSIHAGLVSTQGKTRVVKLGSGQLAYHTGGLSSGQPVYNTIATPMGGYYQVVLPDGSHVWLNAASSIRFPTTFPEGAREVQITGEAYFEIAQKRDQPFRVHVNGMTVTVLGTHFDVMAYQDETAIRTTLVEGSVKITKGDRAMTLTPGQQLSLNHTGHMTLTQNAEITKAIAWKNHLFWFDNDDIRTIMRQVARWYNVAVEIEGDIPGHFTGSLPRNVPVSKVFEVLQKTGSIHYRIESGKIIVSS